MCGHIKYFSTSVLMHFILCIEKYSEKGSIGFVGFPTVHGIKIKTPCHRYSACLQVTPG